MSEAAPITSSRAAKPFEEALMRGNDTSDVRRLRRRVPHTALERAAEQDAVSSRKHVTEITERRVTDLRLRLEDRELPANRLQLRVAEPIPAAEPRTLQP